MPRSLVDGGYGLERQRSWSAVRPSDSAFNRRIVASGDDSNAPQVTRIRNRVTSESLLFQDITAGKTLGRDGIATDQYLLQTPDRCYNHEIHAEHGYVVEDRMLSRCD